MKNIIIAILCFVVVWCSSTQENSENKNNELWKKEEVVYEKIKNLEEIRNNCQYSQNEINNIFLHIWNESQDTIEKIQKIEKSSDYEFRKSNLTKECYKKINQITLLISTDTIHLFKSLIPYIEEQKISYVYFLWDNLWEKSSISQEEINKSSIENIWLKKEEFAENICTLNKDRKYYSIIIENIDLNSYNELVKCWFTEIYSKNLQKITNNYTEFNTFINKLIKTWEIIL